MADNDDNIIRIRANVPALQGLSDMILNSVNLRRIFLILTQLHYSDARNYGAMAEQFQDFVWRRSLPGQNGENPKSKLSIELDYVFDPKKTDQFPGIFVGTGDIDYRQEVLDNKAGYTDDRSGSRNVYTGATTIILRHASLTPDEALALADLSYGYYTGIRDMLMLEMKLKSFAINKLTTPHFFNIDGADKADKRYYADLIMSLSFNASWITFTESHRIKKITLGELFTEFGPQQTYLAPQ